MGESVTAAFSFNSSTEMLSPGQMAESTRSCPARRLSFSAFSFAAMSNSSFSVRETYRFSFL